MSSADILCIQFELYQAQQNVWPDLNSNFDSDGISQIVILKKVILRTKNKEDMTTCKSIQHIT